MRYFHALFIVLLTVALSPFFLLWFLNTTVLYFWLLALGHFVSKFDTGSKLKKLENLVNKYQNQNK